MQHKLNSLIIAILFLVLIQIIGPIFRELFLVMAIYAAAVLLYNHYYLKQNNLYTFWTWVRMLFFLGAALSVYFVIPDSYARGFFLLVATAVLYLFEISLQFNSEQLNFMQTLLTYFGLSIGIFGYQFYLLPSNLIIFSAVFFVTFCLVRSSFDYVPQSARDKNFLSAALGLGLAEVSWALLVLPFHFTVLAVILFNVFYVCWIVAYFQIYNNLTLKKIYFHVLFSVLIAAVALISTPWKP